MDKEIVTLVGMILRNSFLTIFDVLTETNATKRQITYRVEKINQLLIDSGKLPILIGNQKEFLIDGESRNFLANYLFDLKDNLEYYLDRSERKMYLFLWMFVDQDYLSLQHFTSELRISKSTIIQDLNELGHDLKDHHIYIKNDRSKGYYLDGSEMDIRRHMMKIIISSMSEHLNTHIFDKFIEDLHLYTFDFSKLIIKELADEYNIVFVEDRLIEFIYIFIFLTTRIVNGVHIEKNSNDMPNIDMIKTFKEYDFTNALINFFPFKDKIDELDRKYISSWILGISIGNVEDKSEDCLIIGQIVGKIMTRFELLSGVRYKDLELIFRHIFSHFRPAYYRLLFRLPIVNPLKDRVKDEYSSLFALVKETMKPFKEIFSEEVGDDELAYLTMHFASVYTYKSENKISSRKKALIVCLNGIGSSVILYNELRSLFPEIDFQHPIEVSSFDLDEYPVDIIFTTKIFKDLIGLSIPVIKVNALMDANERFNVFREVVSRLGNYGSLSPRTEEITSILRKHLGVVPNEDQLVTELTNAYLRIPNEQSVKLSNNKVSLRDMISVSNIMLKADCKTPEEALQLSGNLLVESQKVLPSYVESVIHLQKSRPSYFVLAPGIALPHTSPENGVIKEAIAILTLKTPIEFGNSDNNPVKYIFFLSALDNESHIGAMGELLELMNNHMFLSLLDQSNDSNELMRYLDSYLNRNVK